MVRPFTAISTSPLRAGLLGVSAHRFKYLYRRGLSSNNLNNMHELPALLRVLVHSTPHDSPDPEYDLGLTLYQIEDN